MNNTHTPCPGSQAGTTVLDTTGGRPDCFPRARSYNVSIYIEDYDTAAPLNALVQPLQPASPVKETSPRDHPRD